jgi:hypothetical protein
MKSLSQSGALRQNSVKASHPVFGRLVIVTPFLFVAACMTAYKQPTSGPTANLHVASEDVILHKGGAKGACGGHEVLYRHRDNETVKIPAGKEIWVGHVIMVDMVTSLGRCEVSYVFTPEAGATYIVVAEKTGKRGCRAELLRVNASGKPEIVRDTKEASFPLLCQL